MRWLYGIIGYILLIVLLLRFLHIAKKGCEDED